MNRHRRAELIGEQRFEARRGPSVIVRVCMVCKREIGPGNQPQGLALVPERNHSHGYCVNCLPAAARDYGITEQELKGIMAEQPSPDARSGLAPWVNQTGPGCDL